MKLAGFAMFAALAASQGLMAEEWTIVQTPHFELYTSGSAEEARETVVFFEQVHDLFASWNAREPSASPRVKIIDFRNEQDYRLYLPNQLAAAFFLSGAAGDFIVTRNLKRETYHVAVHEYVHLVVKRSGLRISTAMNEGLAEFYSTLKVTKAGIEIGTPPVIRLLTLRTIKLVPLAELFTVDTRSPVYRDQRQAEAFYAESWALTHMLLLSPEYRVKSTSYARDMQAGPDPVSALERITGKSDSSILKDLQRYVQRDRFVIASAGWEVGRTPSGFPDASGYPNGVRNGASRTARCRRPP